MKKIACAIFVLGLAVPAFAQGTLTYPDILYYKFNEGVGTSIVNSAVPGGASYAPNFESGMGGFWDSTSPVGSGSAMDFAALDRLVSNYDTNLSQSFTIECWVKTNYDTTSQQPCGVTLPSWCGLGRLWGDYSSGMGLFRCYVGFYNDGANFLGGGFPALNSANVTAVVVADSTWHHIALVFDLDTVSGLGTLTSYVDGNQDQQAVGIPPGNNPGGANFHLGGQQSTGSPFNGVVDEFRWWGEARSQAQIQNSMFTEFSLPIQAAFAASTTSGPNPLLVAFSDLSTTTAAGGITSWLWDFGDGNTSTQQNPCHVYTTTATYSVTLTVGNGTMTDTVTVANLINVGNPAFVVASCGLGDLYLGAPPPPVGWNDGFTLVSTQTGPPEGQGWFFGLYPDLVTWMGLSYPATPGDPLHFLNNGNPSLFPTASLSFPPGTFPGLAGTSLDAVVVYRDATNAIINWTAVSRVNF